MHPARDFAHFLSHHVVDFLVGFIDERDHEVFQHFCIFRVDDARVDVDAFDILFTIHDDSQDAAADGSFDGALLQIILEFLHFLLHFLYFLHHTLHISTKHVRFL